jgi:hypothetical protein
MTNLDRSDLENISTAPTRCMLILMDIVDQCFAIQQTDRKQPKDDDLWFKQALL